MELCLDNHVIRDRQGQIRTKTFDKRQNIISYTIAVLTLLTFYGVLTFDYKQLDFWNALQQTAENVIIMFTQPQATHFTLAEAGYQVLVTIGLAFLTTMIGAVLAIFFGLLAARNLSNKLISDLIKGVVAFIRAVPTVLWVLIFAVAAGLGSVAAVLGLSFHSVGYLIKTYSESFEELDEGVIEALKASGANWWQIVFQAVIPSSQTYLMAWTFIRFEINFANAVAMGAAAGAGGIGYELFMAGNFYFSSRELGVITYFILAFAIILEICSSKLKAKLK
ncbi:PhnE/PtxC family ABC transporter permease [Dendrosporobacter sp. 1207_IL3150]|uniref:PhnE/PtxC family ABC transporter permease n=1 Tax=Dendrosporobacter sp. 1207_IL3150 TaxID=3084054 RepID=UPI002FD9902B